MKKQKSDFGAFANLPPGEGLRLSNITTARKYKANESIYLQDEQPNRIYLVAKGRAKIVRNTPEGYESILCVRGPGDYFCPVPILDGGNQLGTAIAMTDLTLYEIEREDFLNFCKTCPSLLEVVQRDCLSEVRFLLKRLEGFAFRGVRERLAITLLTEARKKPILDGKIELPLTHQDIASLIGASRESVSRHLSMFAKKGIVRLGRGRVTLLDLEALDKIAGG